MGGISVLIMLGMASAIVLAVLALVVFAAMAFIAATVLSIVFACRTGTRRAQGKKLGGLLALPISLYVVSIPILVWFAVSWVSFTAS